jgi:hypothetical protein
VVVPTGLRNAYDYSLNQAGLWAIAYTSPLHPLVLLREYAMTTSGVGHVRVGWSRIYALVVPTAEGLRLRMSDDEWDMTGMVPGMRTEVEAPGRPPASYFLRGVTYAAPHWQWLDFVEVPARPAAAPGK